jgi:hypothetical protein
VPHPPSAATQANDAGKGSYYGSSRHERHGDDNAFRQDIT